MKMEFKPDFDKAADRWEAFWKKENPRPLISIVTPKEGVTPVDKLPYLSGSDGNFEPVIDRLLEWAASHEFVGEAIPFYYLEFGPDTFAAYLGADLQFLPHQPDTSWSIPFVEDWDEVEIKFKPDSKWWQRTVDFAQKLRARCDGKLLIAPACMSANLDVLAAIRGIENLLVDLVECPDKIKRALNDVCRAHSDTLAAYAELFSFDTYGSINLEGFYTKGWQSRPQCDMSCMISTGMFREFVVPALESEAADSDAFVYHLDGPDAIKHLEALCEIEKLDLITWVPGAAHQHKDWTWLFQKITDLGKGYGRSVRDHEQLKSLCRMYKEAGIRNISLSTAAASKTEAEELIAEIEKIFT